MKRYYPRKKADARLIAAAPEMLEALEQLVLLVSTLANVYDAHQIQFLMDKAAYNNAREVIAKVRS